MAQNTIRFHIPYPTEDSAAWFSSFQSMITNVDSLLFSGWEDTNLFVYSDGTVGWALNGGNYELTIASDINIYSPAFARLEYLPVLVPLVVSIPVNHYLVFDLTRGATTSVDLSSSYSVQSSVPISGTSRAFCFHAPNHKLYFMTGLALSLGDIVTGLSPGGGGGGVDRFTELVDCPASYVGMAGQIPAVNGTETGLEFISVPAPLGVEKTILIPLRGGGVTFDSTTVIPGFSYITEVKCLIISSFGTGLTIDVKIMGGGTVPVLMDTTQNNPEIPNLYWITKLDLVSPAGSGFVRVTLGGLGSGAGQGLVSVKYLENSLS